MEIRRKIKRFIKQNTPRSIYRLWLLLRSDTYGKPPEELFGAIYKNGMWGTQGARKFYSGEGSHNMEIVAPYVAAVTNFCRSLNHPPAAVDLGCGDFNVGRLIAPFCNSYIACDIVKDLIDDNAKLFPMTDFRHLDIICEQLPSGDIAFLREVLQHLTNEQIQCVVPKLLGFKHLIVTEHLPGTKEFPPNIDHPAGPGIRLSLGSGIVLNAPPFSLPAKSERVLCEVPSVGGLIRTTLYAL